MGVLKVLFGGFLALVFVLVVVPIGLTFFVGPDIPDHVDGKYLYKLYKDDIELVWERVSQEGIEGIEYSPEHFQPSDKLIAVIQETENSERKGKDIYQRYDVRHTGMRLSGDVGVVNLSRDAEQMSAVAYRIEKDGNELLLCFVDPGPPVVEDS